MNSSAISVFDNNMLTDLINEPMPREFFFTSLFRAKAISPADCFDIPGKYPYCVSTPIWSLCQLVPPSADRTPNMSVERSNQIYEQPVREVVTYLRDLIRRETETLCSHALLDGIMDVYTIDSSVGKLDQSAKHPALLYHKVGTLEFKRPPDQEIILDASDMWNSEGADVASAILKWESLLGRWPHNGSLTLALGQNALEAFKAHQPVSECLDQSMVNRRPDRVNALFQGEWHGIEVWEVTDCVFCHTGSDSSAPWADMAMLIANDSNRVIEYTWPPTMLDANGQPPTQRIVATSSESPNPSGYAIRAITRPLPLVRDTRLTVAAKVV